MKITKNENGNFNIEVNEKEVFGLFMLPKLINARYFCETLGSKRDGKHTFFQYKFPIDIVFEKWEDSLGFLSELREVTSAAIVEVCKNKEN